MDFKIQENETIKCFSSKDYNYIFNKQNGVFARWGATQKDDPEFAPFGPEILDFEIEGNCNGISLDKSCGNNCGKPSCSCNKKVTCYYCYKGNVSGSEYTKFDDFVNVIKKINKNKTLCQIAFGLSSGADINPDLWRICEWCRENGIIPNGTIADVSKETSKKIAKYFGACSVSNHFMVSGSNNLCFNQIEMIADDFKKEQKPVQVNMHYLLAEETYQNLMNEVLPAIKTDKRLENLNAIVFLSYKKTSKSKGDMTPLSFEKFKSLIEKCIEMKISFGSDSCGCNAFNKATNGKYSQFTESCESCLTSSYIDYKGIFYPCSFTPSTKNWKEGIDILGNEKFDWEKDFWYGEKVSSWRENLLALKGECPVFKIRA
jgi:hypothetical protein